MRTPDLLLRFAKISAIVILSGYIAALFNTAAIGRERPNALKAKSHRTARPQNGPAAPVMQMPLVVPLFIQDRTFTSNLIIVNTTNVNTYADVILSGLDGNKLVSQRIGLPPHSQRQVGMDSLLRSVNSPATAGRITIAQSPDLKGMSIASQLTMTYLGSREINFIDEEVAMPSTESSLTLRAVTDMTDGSPVVAITSLAETLQRISIECLSAKDGHVRKMVEIPAGETLVTEACREDGRHHADLGAISEIADERQPRTIGISLTSDGMAGSFAAFGLSSHGGRADHFFTSIPFTDPKMTMSTTTVFTGAPVGSLSLLPDGKYVPQLAFANFSNRSAHVSVNYARMSGETPIVKEVANIDVPGMTVEHLALDGLQGNPDLKSSFLVTADGSPGDVMTKLTSQSDSPLREIELLGKDKGDRYNGGTHPWSLEQGTESTLLLFNHSEKAQFFNIDIGSDSLLWQKAFLLQSMETHAISLRDLIQFQVKDDEGRTLPKDVQSGQINWFFHTQNAGHGRLLQSNHTTSMARNFSCYGGYVIGRAYFLGAWGPTTVNIGQTLATPNVYTDEYTATYQGQCGGNFVGRGGVGLTYNWQSYNTSVVSISGSNTLAYANLLGVSGGTADIDVAVTDFYNCRQDAGGITTVYPTVTVSGPSYVPLRAAGSTGANSMTLTAVGTPSGGTYSWSTTSSNVTLSNAGSASVTVTAAAASAYISDTPVKVTYTVNSNSGSVITNITVSKPTSLLLVTDSTNPTGHTCSATAPSNDCPQSKFIGSGSYTSYLRNRTYHIMDQLSTPSNPRWISGYLMQIQESYTPPSGQCASSSVVTNLTASGDTATDCFYFCSATCQAHGSCGVSATQTVTVNGFQVATKSATWTCSSVSVTP
jgi:hypothetical protein